MSDKLKAPRPTIGQRFAAATNRTILNFGDELYGFTPDKEGYARRDLAELTKLAQDEAEGFEFLDEVMPEHTDLLSAEDHEGTEFRSVVIKAFIGKFKRDLTRREDDHVDDFVHEWFRDLDGGDK